jgi:hypothetical protein
MVERDFLFEMKIWIDGHDWSLWMQMLISSLLLGPCEQVWESMGNATAPSCILLVGMQAKCDLWNSVGLSYGSHKKICWLAWETPSGTVLRWCCAIMFMKDSHTHNSRPIKNFHQRKLINLTLTGNQPFSSFEDKQWTPRPSTLLKLSFSAPLTWMKEVLGLATVRKEALKSKFSTYYYGRAHVIWHNKLTHALGVNTFNIENNPIIWEGLGVNFKGPSTILGGNGMKSMYRVHFLRQYDALPFHLLWNYFNGSIKLAPNWDTKEGSKNLNQRWFGWAIPSIKDDADDGNKFPKSQACRDLLLILLSNVAIT